MVGGSPEVGRGSQPRQDRSIRVLSKLTILQGSSVFLSFPFELVEAQDI